MYWTAFLMGFLGSFHCIGMCGPIVLALPVQGVVYKLIYNLGRAITYTSIGGIIGFVGNSFTLIGWQQSLSIGTGVIMLAVILFTKYKHFDLPLNGFLNRVYLYVKSRLGPLLKSKSSFAPLIIGMLNGLLPCGLVYAAMFTALSMGSITGSAYYMLYFGVGTIPIMLVLGISSRFISMRLRTRLNRAAPYFLGVLAILLILRGLNLGIPFISPSLNSCT